MFSLGVRGGHPKQVNTYNHAEAIRQWKGYNWPLGYDEWKRVFPILGLLTFFTGRAINAPVRYRDYAVFPFLCASLIKVVTEAF